MTTAFTAIPLKMTTSTMRFLGNDMAKSYPTADARSTDVDQVVWISVELKND